MKVIDYNICGNTITAIADDNQHIHIDIIDFADALADPINFSALVLNLFDDEQHIENCEKIEYYLQNINV